MIIKDKNICSGYPTIKGTRVMVTVILANIRDGSTFEEISKNFNINKEDIFDCIDYAIDEIKNKENILSPNPVMEGAWDWDNNSFYENVVHSKYDKYDYLYECKVCRSNIFMDNYCNKCGQKLR